MRLLWITFLILNLHCGIAQNNTKTVSSAIEQPDSTKRFQQWRLALDGGLSCLTYRVASMLYDRNKTYYRHSRDGQHFHINFKFFYTKNSGIGLNYMYFSSAHRSDDAVIMSDGKWLQFGKVHDDITVNYIGLYWGFQHYFTPKHSLHINYSAGWINYFNYRWLWNDYTMKANTFGLVFDIGYDLSINKNFAIGFKTSYLWSNVTTYSKNDGINQYSVTLDKNNHELLSRLDFSIGLRYNYFKARQIK